MIINVYSPCSNTEKFELWGEIEKVMVKYKNWASCVMGDFNAVRVPSEHKGMGVETMNRTKMDRFNSFIDNCRFLDIPVVGRLYTWYRPNGTFRSRLHKILVSESWLLKWPGSSQFVQTRQASYHCVNILLSHF